MSLIIDNLTVSLEQKEILHGVSLTIAPGTVHALMGPNGSGKSTMASALMGDPKYQVKTQKSKVKIDDKNILELEPDERARMGLFLAFQNPIAIPGVTVANLLRTAYRQLHPIEKENGKTRVQDVRAASQFHVLLLEKAKYLGIPKEFLGRPLNEAFSGGEKKKLEMLQAVVLSPKYAIFDEIDTGLDVDALKTVALGIQQLKEAGTGVLIITHYQRILRYAQPDYVHILIDGSIVAAGGPTLAEEIEKNGYAKWNQQAGST